MLMQPDEGSMQWGVYNVAVQAFCPSHPKPASRDAGDELGTLQDCTVHVASTQDPVSELSTCLSCNGYLIHSLAPVLFQTERLCGCFAVAKAQVQLHIPVLQSCSPRGCAAAPAVSDIPQPSASSWTGKSSKGFPILCPPWMLHTEKSYPCTADPAPPPNCSSLTLHCTRQFSNLSSPVHTAGTA